jgi:hypothetical protein
VNPARDGSREEAGSVQSRAGWRCVLCWGAAGSWLAHCAGVDRSHFVILYNYLIFFIS